MSASHGLGSRHGCAWPRTGLQGLVPSHSHSPSLPGDEEHDPQVPSHNLESQRPLSCHGKPGSTGAPAPGHRPEVPSPCGQEGVTVLTVLSPSPPLTLTSETPLRAQGHVPVNHPNPRCL